jgi:hypothetical protein
VNQNSADSYKQQSQTDHFITFSMRTKVTANAAVASIVTMNHAPMRVDRHFSKEDKRDEWTLQFSSRLSPSESSRPSIRFKLSRIQTKSFSLGAGIVYLLLGSGHNHRDNNHTRNNTNADVNPLITHSS